MMSQHPTKESLWPRMAIDWDNTELNCATEGNAPAFCNSECNRCAVLFYVHFLRCFCLGQQCSLLRFGLHQLGLYLLDLLLQGLQLDSVPSLATGMALGLPGTVSAGGCELGGTPELGICSWWTGRAAPSGAGSFLVMANLLHVDSVDICLWSSNSSDGSCCIPTRPSSCAAACPEQISNAPLASSKSMNDHLRHSGELLLSLSPRGRRSQRKKRVAASVPGPRPPLGFRSR